MKHLVLLVVLGVTLACNVQAKLAPPPPICDGYTGWWGLGVEVNPEKHQSKVIAQSMWAAWFDPGINITVDDTIPVDIWLEKWSSGLAINMQTTSDTAPDVVVMRYSTTCNYREAAVKDPFVFWYIGSHKIRGVAAAERRK